MVQPKYSPEEALQRVKLMMGYDTRKTLKENKETLEEQTWWKSMAAGATTGAIGAGAVSGGALAIPGAVVGAVLGLVMDLSQGTVSEDKVTKLMQACVTNKNEIGKKTLGAAELDPISDSIFKAVDGLQTDEDAIKAAFEKIPTIPDLCGLVDNYAENYTESLVDALKGDLDGDSEWRDYVYLPLRPAIRASKSASQEEGKDEDCKTNPNQAKCKSKTGGGYKPCSGTYSYGCKSEVIAKVQGCLGGLVQDGKFGPKTKAKLVAKGFETFTDADIEKICTKTAETKLTQDIDTSELGQEESLTSSTNTNQSQVSDPNAKSGID